VLLQKIFFIEESNLAVVDKNIGFQENTCKRRRERHVEKKRDTHIKTKFNEMKKHKLFHYISFYNKL